VPRRQVSLEDDDAARRPRAADEQTGDEPEDPVVPAQDDEAELPARRRPATAPRLDDEQDRPTGPAKSDEEHPLRPGDVGETAISFWEDESVARFRAEWHEVKAEFVDDPVTALTRAHDLLTAAVNELSGSLLAERDELDPLRTTSTPDTESMRMAMRGYREFLDRILSL
jgi:hypothetical protein